MNKKRGYTFSYFGSETELLDNRIIWRPTVIIEGQFHRRIGRLVLDLLTVRLNEILSDISKYLTPVEDEVVSGNE